VFPVAVFTRLVASILGSNDLLLKSLTKYNIELADLHDDFIGAWSSKHQGRGLYCFTETLQTSQFHIPVGEVSRMSVVHVYLMIILDRRCHIRETRHRDKRRDE
jgi:hypothetical protein